MPSSSYIVGVDLDNTIINYGECIFKLARERGWVHHDIGGSKRKIRDLIRQLPEGEREWQRLQAQMYGPKIDESKPCRGVKKFLELCQRHGFLIYIISHKTEYSLFDQTATNLREAALAWLRKKKLIGNKRIGLTQERVFFEATRTDKVKRIGELQCTHFIDDLEETFLEDSFPSKTKKILYADDHESPSVPGVKVLRNWNEIIHYFFKDAKN